MTVTTTARFAVHAEVVPEELPVSPADLRGVVPLTSAESFSPRDRMWSEEVWSPIRHGHKPARHGGQMARGRPGHRSYCTGAGQVTASTKPGFCLVAGGWRISSAREGDRGSYRRAIGAFEATLPEELISRLRPFGLQPRAQTGTAC
jgi:hypothetical protein